MRRSGHWGTLIASSSLYDGFDPYEDDRWLIAIAGAPFLDFEPNLTHNGRTRYTRAILEFARDNPRCRWHEVLDGPCSILIVDKKEAEARVVTDRMGYIPVFMYAQGGALSLGTKVTATAHLGGHSVAVDHASVAEFVLHGVVSFPHTLYEHTTQLEAGTDAIVDQGGGLGVTSYYRPVEGARFSTVDEAAEALRDGLIASVRKIMSRSSHAALLMSGGEDSRVVLAAVPRDRSVQCITFTDTLNREAAIARRIATLFGAPWQFVQRSPDHYLKDFDYCCQFIGNEVAINQANFLGMPEEAGLEDYDAVLGGLCSDFFLKGYAAGLVHRQYHNYPMGLSKPERLNEQGLYESVDDLFLELQRTLDGEIASAVIERKLAHFRFMQSIRPQSAAEWRRVWPASQAVESGQFNQNRRVFRTYEPFHMNGVLDVAVSTPLSWKINRKLFHKAFSGHLGRAAWFPHSDGWLPALSTRANIPAGVAVAGYRWAVGRMTGTRSVNNAPWPVWSKLVARPVFNELAEDLRGQYAVLEPDFRTDYDHLLSDAGLSPQQRARLLQTLYCVRDAGSGV